MRSKIHRRTKHAGGHIHADPDMSVLLEQLSAQSAPAADIQDEGALVLWKRQQLKCSMCHLSLYILYPCATDDQLHTLVSDVLHKGLRAYLAVYFVASVSP